MGRRVSVHAWRLFCLPPPWPALDPGPSLVTGLDSSNSALRGFDLMWGWHSGAHSRVGVQRGGIRRGGAS